MGSLSVAHSGAGSTEKRKDGGGRDRGGDGEAPKADIDGSLVMSLLALARPLEAFLATGVATRFPCRPAIQRRGSSHNKHPEESSREAFLALSSSYPGLHELLPKCIVPLFEATVGLRPNRPGGDRKLGSATGTSERGKEGGKNARVGAAADTEGAGTFLRCLRAIFEVFQGREAIPASLEEALVPALKR